MMRRFLGCLLIGMALAGCARRAEVRSEADLVGGRIGVLTSMAHREVLQEVFPDAKFFHYEELPSLCLALRGGKIDALVCREPGLEALLSNNPAFVELPFRTVPDSVAVAFQPTGTELAARFNEFLHLILKP